eukprot:COSAG04_NODE_94_length_26569_cov_27.995127_20_plen_56_part_00
MPAISWRLTARLTAAKTCDVAKKVVTSTPTGVITVAGGCSASAEMVLYREKSASQ